MLTGLLCRQVPIQSPPDTASDKPGPTLPLHKLPAVSADQRLRNVLPFLRRASAASGPIVAHHASSMPQGLPLQLAGRLCRIGKPRRPRHWGEGLRHAGQLIFAATAQYLEAAKSQGPSEAIRSVLSGRRVQGYSWRLCSCATMPPDRCSQRGESQKSVCGHFPVSESAPGRTSGRLGYWFG